MTKTLLANYTRKSLGKGKIIELSCLEIKIFREIRGRGPGLKSVQ
jgi:hypothetical protein